MATMKLILRADVDALGRLGEIVSVKVGYGRNYLLPKGLAMQASPNNLKQFELERKKLQAKMDGVRAAAQAVADKLASLVVTIPARVGEGDKLYGSVTTVNIADALAAMGVDIDRRKIVLEDPLRALGEYSLEVKVHPDVQAAVKVAVIRHGQPAEAPKQEE